MHVEGMDRPGATGACELVWCGTYSLEYTNFAHTYYFGLGQARRAVQGYFIISATYCDSNCSGCKPRR